MTQATATTSVYNTDDAAHEADFSTPLHHGVIRYIPSESLPLTIRNSLPAKNDRHFLYVPVGYLDRNSDFISKILAALDLKLPNICVVTAETTGSVREQQEESFRVENSDNHVIAKDWTEEHTKEVLSAKVGRLLESVMESSMGVGAWLLPDCPRRHNGAAQMVCEALPAEDGDTRSVALGLIGLDEEEEGDKELKESLKAAMVPLGSPIKTVATLLHDVNLKDGAPCPLLTHLVIFGSPEEKARFRTTLLDMVPDFMLAFGNITRKAMEHVFETAKSGSPVVLMKHTGTNTDSLCRMFRHVKRHHAAATTDDTKATSTAKGVTHPIPSGNDFDENTMTKLPPMDNEQDELVRLFINTWPLGFNVESVVLADPLIVTGPALQQRLLAALTAAFDLKTGSAATKMMKRKALQYAWSFYEAANSHSHKKKHAAELLHVQLVCFTLLSIVAAVMYNQVYGGGQKPNNPTQLLAYVLTIILPLYITSLKQESDKGVALSSWGAFKVAAFRIESEIFKFRTQVGIYRVANKSERALQEPVERFAKKIKDIWIGVQRHLQQDGLAIPDDFWDFDPDSHFPVQEQQEEKGENAQSLGDLIQDEPTEMTPILSSGVASPAQHGYDEEAPPKQHPVVVSDNDDDDIVDVPFVDDKYSPMKVEHYMDSRMQTAMQDRSDQIQKMVVRNERLSSAIKGITIFSGATAALSLQWCVPIVLGVSAAVGTGQEFRKYPRRIELGNNMVVKLNELKLWWMGLSMYEKQLPHNKDHIILTSERAIVTELESSYNGKVGSIEEES